MAAHTQLYRFPMIFTRRLSSSKCRAPERKLLWTSSTFLYDQLRLGPGASTRGNSGALRSLSIWHHIGATPQPGGGYKNLASQFLCIISYEDAKVWHVDGRLHVLDSLVILFCLEHFEADLQLKFMTSSIIESVVGH